MRSEKTRRKTRTVVNTNEPIWNQTFIYSPLGHGEMKCRALEFTLLDFDRYGSSEFLGQILIELATSSTPLDDESEWYILLSHDEILAQLVSLFEIYVYRI